MLATNHKSEYNFTHRSLIAALSITNTEGLDVSVSFNNGSYRANIGCQCLVLPLDDGSAKDILAEQCPNLSPRFADLLVMLLSHRSWTSAAAYSYPRS